MSDFYQALHDGMPAAMALMAARRRSIGTAAAPNHPARWAPFILMGGLAEPRSSDKRAF